MPDNTPATEPSHVPARDDAQLPPRPLTRAQFCAAENMSLSTFHKLKRAGNAPAEEYFPGTSIIRISPKAIRAWHAKMEAWRDSADAKLEQERRIAAARAAGNKAIQSPLHV